jgi:hypothetical protein
MVTEFFGVPALERGRRGRSRQAAQARHAGWAEEMRAWGWQCLPPDLKDLDTLQMIADAITAQLAARDAARDAASPELDVTAPQDIVGGVR